MKTNSDEMEISVITVITGFWGKIITALGTVGGWCWACFLALLSFLTPIKYIILLVAILVLIDTALGVYNNRKHILSSKLRLVIVKLFFYIGSISLLFSMETLIAVAILYKILFVLISLTEMISISANILIINPSIKVISLFKTLLTGEIAKKLEISKSEVEKIFEDKKNENKKGE